MPVTCTRTQQIIFRYTPETISTKHNEYFTESVSKNMQFVFHPGLSVSAFTTFQPQHEHFL